MIERPARLPSPSFSQRLPPSLAAYDWPRCAPRCRNGPLAAPGDCRVWLLWLSVYFLWPAQIHFSFWGKRFFLCVCVCVFFSRFVCIYFWGGCVGVVVVFLLELLLLASLTHWENICGKHAKCTPAAALLFSECNRWKLFVSVGQIRLSFRPPATGPGVSRRGIHGNHCMSFVKVSSHLALPQRLPRCPAPFHFHLLTISYWCPLGFSAFPPIFSGYLASLSRILIYVQAEHLLFTATNIGRAGLLAHI